MLEKITALFFFFNLGAGSEYRFKRVGMEAGIVDFGGEGHGGRSEILDLFEFEVKLAGFGCKVGHVGFGATGIAVET